MVVTKRKVLVCCLILSILLNIVAFNLLFQNEDEVKSVEDFEKAQQKYPLLSKRILQDYPQDLLMHFFNLRKEVNELVAPYGADFGLYFEYLPTGTSIGVNANEEFYAASLFKVPVVMAYYHHLEEDEPTHDEVFKIQKKHLDREFGNLWKKGEGHKIKASDTVKLALIESDNTAVKLLADRVTARDLEHVYHALDLELRTDKEGALVSARNYASILKALFFASVLNKESSAEILDLLTKTKFPDKLAAGVPEEIAVAHKIGNFKDKEGREGFRDCGIVYVPRRPYILCMFSVGDEEVARERMQRVSRTIYNFVSSEKVTPAH